MEAATRLLGIPKSECPDILSSTVRMVKIMGSHWRSSGTFRMKFVRSATRKAFSGKDSSRKFCLRLDGKKVRNWACPLCSSKTTIILLGSRGWHQNGWREAGIDETCLFWRTNFISEWRIFRSLLTFNVSVNRTQLFPMDRNVSIKDFCWSSWKIARMG